METLAPSILQTRNSFLEQFENEQLKIVSKKLSELFDVEKDPIKRIILLSSRVETIRKRVEQICKDEIKQKQIEEPVEKKENILLEDNKDNKDNNEKIISESWIRVIMKESTEVNGVRFPEGIQIDVTENDSKKLIESGKAAIIT